MLPLNTIVTGDCRQVMATWPEESVDSLVCDPPYDLVSIGRRFSKPNAAPVIDTFGGQYARLAGGFMGKAWDGTGVAFDPKTWEAAYRIAKPGAHLLAFGGARTYHRMVCAIEDAGWEIRDCLVWAYCTGFPKSLKVARAIDKAAKGHPQGSTRGDPDSPNSGKFRTQATEGKRSAADTGQQFGAGPGQFMREQGEKYERDLVPESLEWTGFETALKPAWEPIVLARKPLHGTVASNVLEYRTGALNIDGCRIGTSKNVPASAYRVPNAIYGGGIGSLGTGPTGSGFDPNVGRWPSNVVLTGDNEGHAIFDGDVEGVVGGGTSSGSYSRFFLIPKASRSDREPTLDATLDGGAWGGDDDDLTPGKRRTVAHVNDHPTVKPTELMRHLVRLVTPPGGVVLDPFAGSGSTLVAAQAEGFEWIGIEQDPQYVEICEARLNGAPRGMGL